MYTHTHTHREEYYSALKKKEILSFTATWVSLDDIIVWEICWFQEDISTLSHFYVESKKLNS